MVVLWDFFSVFPAGAGMILGAVKGFGDEASGPRGSGDDPLRIITGSALYTCSPRERG